MSQFADDVTAEASTTPVSGETGEIKPDIESVAVARARADALLADIQGIRDAARAGGENIEQSRVAAEVARGQIEGQAAATKQSAEAFYQQLEASKATVAELGNIAATLQTTNSQTKENSAAASVTLEALRTLSATAAEAAARVEALKTQVEQSAQVAAQRSQHIEDGRVYVDSKRAEIDVILNTAQQAATNAEAQHQTSRTTADHVQELYSAAQTIKAKAESAAQGVRDLRERCEEYARKAKKIADMAETTETKLAAYESKLAELEAQSTERLRTIESLLPGAASAGLASAFLSRREYFRWPQRIWQSVFVACLLVLFVIAGVHTGPNGLEYGLLPKTDATLTFEHLGLSLLYRLPFALPLIWLAFHASHKAALSQRVEEDYAFKETVSRSFEGYRREMAELNEKTPPDSALSRLCTGVLAVITNPPGRIYERHALNKTPLNALAESATPVAEAAAKIKPLRMGD